MSTKFANQLSVSEVAFQLHKYRMVSLLRIKVHKFKEEIKKPTFRISRTAPGINEELLAYIQTKVMAPKESQLSGGMGTGRTMLGNPWTN